MWAYTNRPLGDSFVSFWNQDKSGKIKGETSVSISFDNGTLKRVKSPEVNGYNIDALSLGAIGTDIPEEVSSLFDITDLNIANQDDRPFLLAESAGDVAKYLNKLVKLDKIDTVLAEVESKKRAIKKEADGLDKSIEVAEKELSKYDWIEKGEALYKSIEERGKELQEAWNESGALDADLADAEEARKECEKLSNQLALIAKSEGIAKDIEAVSKSLTMVLLEQNSDTLQRTIEAAKEAKKGLVIMPLINDRTIQEIEEVDKEMKETADKVGKITEIVIKLKGHLASIESIQEQIEEALKELPNMCPTCGAQLKEGSCSE